MFKLKNRPNQIERNKLIEKPRSFSEWSTWRDYLISTGQMTLINFRGSLQDRALDLQNRFNRIQKSINDRGDEIPNGEIDLSIQQTVKKVSKLTGRARETVRGMKSSFVNSMGQFHFTNRRKEKPGRYVTHQELVEIKSGGITAEAEERILRGKYINRAPHQTPYGRTYLTPDRLNSSIENRIGAIINSWYEFNNCRRTNKITEGVNLNELSTLPTESIYDSESKKELNRLCNRLLWDLIHTTDREPTEFEKENRLNPVDHTLIEDIFADNSPQIKTVYAIEEALKKINLEIETRAAKNELFQKLSKEDKAFVYKNIWSTISSRIDSDLDYNELIDVNIENQIKLLKHRKMVQARAEDMVTRLLRQKQVPAKIQMRVISEIKSKAEKWTGYDFGLEDFNNGYGQTIAYRTDKHEPRLKRYIDTNEKLQIDTAEHFLNLAVFNSDMSDQFISTIASCYTAQHADRQNPTFQKFTRLWISFYTRNQMSPDRKKADKATALFDSFKNYNVKRAFGKRTYIPDMISFDYVEGNESNKFFYLWEKVKAKPELLAYIDKIL